MSARTESEGETLTTLTTLTIPTVPAPAHAPSSARRGHDRDRHGRAVARSSP